MTGQRQSFSERTYFWRNTTLDVTVWGKIWNALIFVDNNVFVLQATQSINSSFGGITSSGSLFVSPERSSERDYVILYVVCSMSMYVVIFCKIDHCIQIHWCIPMGLGHNDPWVESHIWPQQMWGQRSSRGQWPLVQVLVKRFTISTYFDVFSWDLDTMILG